jgi:hypothetical protein
MTSYHKESLVEIRCITTDAGVYGFEANTYYYDPTSSFVVRHEDNGYGYLTFRRKRDGTLYVILRDMTGRLPKLPLTVIHQEVY